MTGNNQALNRRDTAAAECLSYLRSSKSIVLLLPLAFTKIADDDDDPAVGSFKTRPKTDVTSGIFPQPLLRKNVEGGSDFFWGAGILACIFF